MFARLLPYLTLPAEVTAFERRYVQRTNRIAIGVLLAHLPALLLVAWWNDMDLLTTALLSALAIAGPLVAVAVKAEPRRISEVCAVAAVLLAAVLVHVGQGPMQIEMHFQFFVVIATFAIFANPRVILIAAGTIALHHAALWALYPASVFNYRAAATVIGVHVLFVVLESMAACFIARTFFDNVIRLDRKVSERTAELQRRERDVRLLLDSADEGFMTMDAGGNLAEERSAVVAEWLGDLPPDATWFEVLAEVASLDAAARTEVAWQAVVDDLLPVELTLAQMPSRIAARGRHLDVAYRLVSEPGTPLRALVILRDATEQVAREAHDADRAEDLQLLAALLDDPVWTRTFLADAARLAHEATAGIAGTAAARALHTLKGNARVAGFSRIAALCHEVEELLAAEGRGPTAEDLEPVLSCVRRLVARAETLSGATRPPPARRESVRPALDRARDHALRAAREAGKDLEVIVDDGGVHVDTARWSAIWSNLVHAVQNAVDHGLEPVEERLARGKAERGCLLIRAFDQGGRVMIELEDDGRGLAWEAIAERARALGLPAETKVELARAVFQDGLTTVQRATTTSGRGVGLASLRAAALAIGGDVSLEGAEGLGATLRIAIPHGPATAPLRAQGRHGDRRAPAMLVPQPAM